jgi:general secretion pathway protein D
MMIGTNRSWSAIIVVGIVLLMGTLSSAARAPQEPGRVPMSEAERKRMLERLARQTLQSRQAGRQPTAAAPQQAQPPAPVPVQTPAPTTAPPPPPVPPAVSSAPRETGKVQLNYENADLYDFINQISSMLGLSPLIVDSDIKGSVNIINTGPMSKEDVLPLFTLILKNNNAALVKEGNVYQIVPISSALKRGVEIIDVPTPVPAEKTGQENPPASVPEGPRPKPSNPAAPGQATPSGPSQSAAQNSPPSTQAEEKVLSGPSRLATYVIRVEFVPVKDLIEPIKLFMTEGGVIMPYERTNMLILTDYTDSASRILEIIHMLDNNYLDPDLVDLIKIKNNASADVAEDLKKIFGSGSKDSATGISFVSLDRLNALFVIASSKRGLSEIKHWISQLDAESGRNIQTYVYVVENSTASNIAMMLSALYGGEGSSGATPSGAEATGAGGAALSGGRNQSRSMFGVGSAAGSLQSGASTSPFYNSQSTNQGYNSYGGGQGGFMSGSSFGVGQRLGPQLNVSRSITSQILRGGEFSGLQDTVRLVVDDINNSLIIQATAADYAYIMDTIKKMDVLPRQVIIDARIFSVELTDNLSYGVNAFLQRKGDTSQGDTITTGSLQGGVLSANTFAFVGNSRQILLQLEALRTKTKVKMLEAPSVLALDGMQASINVGAEYPYPGGSYTSSAGGSTTSVQYRETGVTLLVLPRISASGSVTLDITQEISSPGATVAISSGENAPSFSKSLVSTSFYVKDSETVAIAGLMTDSHDVGRSGIPYLSQIPLLGSLFGVSTKNSRRTELIILITPHVVRTHEKLQEVTEELKDSLRNVRKLADEEDRKRMEDIQDALKDREKREEKLQNKSESTKPEK